MSKRYAIVGGKLIDGTGAAPVENSLVLTDENGKISYAGPHQELPSEGGYEVIDAVGKTVMPGIVDTHLHFSGNRTDNDNDWVIESNGQKQALAVKQAYDALTHGLTTVGEIGRNGIAIRDLVNMGEMKGPRIFATGLGFCRVAGHGDSHHLPLQISKDSHPWGYQADGPWELRRAIRMRLREEPDAIKIWATGGGIWRWDSDRLQLFCSEEIQAIAEECKMVGIPLWAHSYNNFDAAYDCVRFGCTQLIHGFELDDRTMDLMAEKGTYFTPTIGFLPTWYGTYPPEWTPELDKFEGETVVEKGLNRTYQNLRRAHELGVTLTIGSDSFALVTPYGYVTCDEMISFVENAGIPVMDTIVAGTLNGAKMLGHEDEFGSLEAGKFADILVINGDVINNIRDLNPDKMDVIMKEGEIVIKNAL
ncbi:amidohydrolase family protein [Collinsella sp. AGMB00827]|uniref:Amidohydrolase family protein n=1 Tax=Collinsella ureilytica TaxID=2869515 RepID=A0ABS7MNZ7_9ACTN|nr:amidohydrolase family protein [Collinsella urealyticum]MBY4798125.1 amidohydrolase family protein [Collinsella urealyticum]